MCFWTYVRPRHKSPEDSCMSYLQGFAGPESLGEALKGCHLVIIPAGVPRKPGMTRDDLFKVQLKLSLQASRLLPVPWA